MRALTVLFDRQQDAEDARQQLVDFFLVVRQRRTLQDALEDNGAVAYRRGYRIGCRSGGLGNDDRNAKDNKGEADSQRTTDSG